MIISWWLWSAFGITVRTGTISVCSLQRHNAAKKSLKSLEYKATCWHFRAFQGRRLRDIEFRLSYTTRCLQPAVFSHCCNECCVCFTHASV